MMEYLILYLIACLMIAAAGRQRKLGFWGYLFFSAIFTPLAGLIMVYASEVRARPRRDGSSPVDPRAAVRFGLREATRRYEERIGRLIRSGKISLTYAEHKLDPLLDRLPETIRITADGKHLSPLDLILDALESLPDRDRNRIETSGR